MNRITRTLLAAGVALALPLAALADTATPAPSAATPSKSAAKPMHKTTASHQTTTVMKTGATPAATGSATTPMKTTKKSAQAARWIDLNNATREQLMGLSGVTGEMADAIIAGRPYTSKAQLLDKKVVDAKTYRKISKYLTAKPTATGTGQ